jgi:hypothetical protein
MQSRHSDQRQQQQQLKLYQLHHHLANDPCPSPPSDIRALRPVSRRRRLVSVPLARVRDARGVDDEFGSTTAAVSDVIKHSRVTLTGRHYRSKFPPQAQFVVATFHRHVPEYYRLCFRVHQKPSARCSSRNMQDTFRRDSVSVILRRTSCVNRKKQSERNTPNTLCCTGLCSSAIKSQFVSHSRAGVKKIITK